MQLFVKNWNKGLITRIEKESVPRGGASESLNWHFLGDRAELRRGRALMGSDIAGAGNVTFVRVGRKYDGTQIPFFGYLRKLLYYDAATVDHIEIGADTLPIAASGEDISTANYQSLAGSFMYLSSPNSSVYKIPIANPGSAVDLLSTVFRGYIRAALGRLFLWNRKDKNGGSDKTGLYLSTIDRDSLADYDLTTAEQIGTGNGALVTFAATLAFKAANAKKTVHFPRVAAAVTPLKAVTGISQQTSAIVTAVAHGLAVGDIVVFQDVVGMTQINNRIAVVLTASTADVFSIDIDTSGFTIYGSGGSVGKAELFTDTRSGTLSGSFGGTGVVNYATGAISVTFSAPVTNLAHIVSDYYTEDSTAKGIVDFNEGSGSSIADSQTFRQDDAGFFQNLGIIGSTIYCLHSIKTYALRLISSSEITNQTYRNAVGIPNWRGSVETGEGVYFLDTTDSMDPKVRLLEVSVYTADVIPRSISDQLDLSGYLFDKTVIFKWGNYILVSCRTQNETINNRVLMFHTIWKTWEIHSYRIADMDSYNGALIAGDSGSNNLFKLFSGLADEDSAIENMLILGDDDLDKEGVKDVRRMKVGGEIGDDQQIDVSYSIDNAPFVFIKSILGNGPYVDIAQRKRIGPITLGEEMIGGGNAPADSVFASPYELEFYVGTARFSRIRIAFEAKKVGYASVSEYGYVDFRDKGKRLPVKYQS